MRCVTSPPLRSLQGNFDDVDFKLFKPFAYKNVSAMKNASDVQCTVHVRRKENTEVHPPAINLDQILKEKGADQDAFLQLL